MVSPLPCPPRTGRGGNPQQLGSHKKVFKRKYKIPDWSGLGDDVTEPRQAAGLSSCGVHALILRGRGWGTVPSHWLLSHHLLFSWKRRYSPQDRQVPGHGETANIPWQKKSLEGQMPVSRWNQSLGQIFLLMLIKHSTATDLGIRSEFKSQLHHLLDVH